METQTQTATTEEREQMEAIPERLARLDAYTLDHGDHGSFDDGHCGMELVSWLAGEEFTDHPQCACPVLTSFVVSWNDGLPDEERTELLRDLLPPFTCVDCGAPITDDEPWRYKYLCYGCALHHFL